jgi:type IV pilus assembly protein PilE
MRRSAGFTLLELVFAMAVLAILVTIAIPSYQDHLRKGRRAAAETFLIDVGSRQQQYLLDARSYAVGPTALAALNMAVPADVAPFYTISVEPTVATTPPTYRIVATPVAGSVQASDGVLAIDQAGSKTRAGNPGW